MWSSVMLHTYDVTLASSEENLFSPLEPLRNCWEKDPADSWLRFCLAFQLTSNVSNAQNTLLYKNRQWLGFKKHYPLMSVWFSLPYEQPGALLTLLNLFPDSVEAEVPTTSGPQPCDPQKPRNTSGYIYFCGKYQEAWTLLLATLSMQK